MTRLVSLRTIALRRIAQQVEHMPMLAALLGARNMRRSSNEGAWEAEAALQHIEQRPCWHAEGRPRRHSIQEGARVRLRGRHKPHKLPRPSRCRKRQHLVPSCMVNHLRVPTLGVLMLGSLKGECRHR